MESSNLCILGISSFLVLIWLLSLWGFGACRDPHDKPRFIENGFRKRTYCVFGGENLTGSSLRKFPHLPCVVTYSYFEVSRFSLFVWLVLVVILPTKLVSPHSEFICKSYGGFSSFRTKSGSRTKSGHLQFIPDAIRNDRENLRIAVGFGPAAGSSFRTKSGSRTKSGHLQFIPDAIRNDRENLRIAVGRNPAISGRNPR